MSPKESVWSCYVGNNPNPCPEEGSSAVESWIHRPASFNRRLLKKRKHLNGHLCDQTTPELY
ncbi:hypothetical protein ATANTOWER_005860, partial [Ataeniobius toweri]|nr:hypothetical protein [Ataeniobius toweri]